MRLKHGMVATAVVGVIAALAACSSSGSTASSSSTTGSKALTDVTFGYPSANLNYWASAIMTQDPSYCAPYGVKVSSVLLNATSVTPALDDDDVNFTYTSGTTVVAMASGAVHNEKVVAYMGANSPAGVYGIWAGPQITKASQLVGKTIAATSATSPGHIGGLALLQKAGVSASQVHFTYVATSNAALLDALAHGTIAGAWNNGPLPAANVTAGDHIVVPLTSDPVMEAMTSNWAIGNSAWMSAHPAATKGFLECLGAATKAGRSTDPATLSKLQGLVGKMMGSTALAAEAWPEYPISAGLLPMTAANIATLQTDMSLQLQKKFSLSAIQGIVDTNAMNGVTPVPVVNPAGTSKYPFYSGK